MKNQDIGQKQSKSYTASSSVGRAITSLAILKVNWDLRKKDYIDNFVPFAMNIIGSYKYGAQVTIQQVQIEMQEQYGILIPQAALKLIIMRVVKEGLLRRESGLFIRQQVSYVSKHLKKIEGAKTLVSTIISELSSYCKDRFQLSWSIQETETALLDFLGVYDADVLLSTTEGTIFPFIGKSKKNSRYIVSSYICEKLKKGGPSIEALETLVKGHVLACAIVFPNPNNIFRKFNNTRFFLDTKFLLRLIGLQDIGMQPACQELADMIYKQQGNLRVFEHTVNEIHDILEAIANRTPHIETTEGFGDVWDYLMAHGYTPSDAILINAKLSKTLIAKNVLTERVPDEYEKYGVDEEKLLKLLKEEITGLRTEAIRKDLDSITAIYRIRRGNYFNEFERCPAFLVTTNKGLTKVASRFFNTNLTDRVPICLTDIFLTNLLWLKGQDLAKSFPRQLLVSNCIACLDPNENLWRKYIDEIKKLREDTKITEDDYYLLRYSMQARQDLMELTLGDETEFKTVNVSEILGNIKQRIRDEEHKEVMVLVSKSEEKLAAVLKERDIFAKELYEKQKMKTISLLKREILAISISKILAICIRIILALPMLCGILISILGIVSVLQIKAIFIIVIAFFSILGQIIYAYDWLKGTMVSNFCRRIEIKTKNTILHILERIFE